MLNRKSLTTLIIFTFDTSSTTQHFQIQFTRFPFTHYSGTRTCFNQVLSSIFNCLSDTWKTAHIAWNNICLSTKVMMMACINVFPYFCLIVDISLSYYYFFLVFLSTLLVFLLILFFLVILGMFLSDVKVYVQI